MQRETGAAVPSRWVAGCRWWSTPRSSVQSVMMGRAGSPEEALGFATHARAVLYEFATRMIYLGAGHIYDEPPRSTAMIRRKIRSRWWSVWARIASCCNSPSRSMNPTSISWCWSGSTSNAPRCGPSGAGPAAWRHLPRVRQAVKRHRRFTKSACLTPSSRSSSHCSCRPQETRKLRLPCPPACHWRARSSASDACPPCPCRTPTCRRRCSRLALASQSFLEACSSRTKPRRSRR